MSVRIHTHRAIGAAACALAALAAGAATASASPPPGMWTETGNLVAQQRGEDTSTALPDGRLLVAGGFDDLRGSSSNTEVWDPATDGFAPGGCLGDRRVSHLAIALNDGRVLISGGRCSSPERSITTSEIYDPATGAFIPAGPRRTPGNAGSIALNDGRILSLDGDDGTELFDPIATDPATGLKGRWKAAGFLHVPVRDGASMTKLADGRVLLVGGETGGAFTSDDVEIFDPATGQWTQTAKITVSRREHIAALLPNGTVLVAGGLHVVGFTETYLKTTEIYDPVTAMWSPGPPMSVARATAAGVTLAGGRLLAIGGQSSRSDAELSSEIYDPVTGTWAATAGAPLGLHFRGAVVLLADGRVLATGGGDAPELFDPATGTWSAAAAPPFAPGTLTALSNGKVLGRGGDGFHRAAELYDPAANSWTQFGIQGDNRRSHTATLLGNGKVLLAGGVRGDDATLASAELYDPVSGISAPTGSLATARSRATATRLLDGKVLVTGGRGSDGAPLDSAELYDPASGTWGAAGTIGARRGHTANLLPDGRVLVVGGLDAAGAPLDSAVIYDPAANSWSAVASIPVARSAFSATTLADGRVLVAGGKDAAGHPLASVEIYGPGNTWTAGHPLATARHSQTANALAGNRVLVAGGMDSDGTVLRSTEIYEAAADAWSAGDPMTHARFEHSATTLADGRILAHAGPHFTGGFVNYDNSAEVYDPGGEARGSFLPTGAPRHEGWSTMTLLSSGKVLAVGGGPTQQRAELFNPLSERWSTAASMSLAHGGLRTVLLADGRVLVAGGAGPAEIYDRRTNRWTTTGAMTTQRDGFAAALLGDGRVLAVGGTDFTSATAEVFDPVTGIWSAAPSSAIWRGDQASAISLVPPGCGTNCGKALLVGGSHPRTSQLLELFDPATNTFSSPGTTAESRGGPQLIRLPDGRVFIFSGGSDEIYDPAQPDTLAAGFPHVSRASGAIAPLPDGRVLLAGGIDAGRSRASAEVYDPATGRWSQTGSMTTPRAGVTLTPLATGPYSACGPNCGKVLLTGGYAGPFDTATLPTAELYTPQPQITGIAAAAGDVAGGTQVTITGHALASVSRVRFGSSDAVSFVPDEQTPDTKLTVTVPPHAPGTVDVRVANPGGTSDVGAADRFTYTAAAAAAPAASPAPAPDTTPPVLRRLRVSPSRFVAGSGLPRLGRASQTGTTISFLLSEVADVRLAFASLRPGRRVGSSCRAASRTLAARPRCTRIVTVTPSVRIADAPAGLDHVRFEARLSRTRTLTPGGYRLTVTATDAAGNRSLPKRTQLTVVRRR